jgi:hypothetical protein
VSALYPNVPVAAGVPVVLRQAGTSYAAEASAVQARTTLPASPLWGIYDADGRVSDPAWSFMRVGFVGEYRISDYPIEKGDFQSYNRVRVPNSMRLAVTCGEALGARQAMLSLLERYQASTKLVDVVTPERTYIGMNLVHLAYDRSADAGAGMLTVEVGFEEVRQTASVAYSVAKAAPGTTISDGAAIGTSTTTTPSPAIVKPKAASAARPVNRGSVQAVSAEFGRPAKLISRAGGVDTYEISLK